VPIVAKNYERYVGSVVGDGHCVNYVREVSGAPPTSRWRRGELVRGLLGLEPGTVIATFDEDGRYGNHLDGRSHAAILVRVLSTGFNAFDQWIGHPVSERHINYRAGRGSPANDGDAYYVVELEGDLEAA
jgi:hypothetical protein